MQQFCFTCGRRLEPDTRFCTGCGTQHAGAGERQEDPDSSLGEVGAKDYDESTGFALAPTSQYRATDPGSDQWLSETAPTHITPNLGGGLQQPHRHASRRGSLLAVGVGLLLGLIAAGAAIWFLAIDRGVEETATESDGTLLAEQDQAAPSEADVSEPNVSESNLETSTSTFGEDSQLEPESGPAETPSTTTLDFTTDADHGQQEADTDTSGQDPASEPQDEGLEPACPNTADTDNRTTKQEALLLEEWSGGPMVVMLCQARDGSLTYFGRSRAGTIYLDAGVLSDGFFAQNGATLYELRSGQLNIFLDNETLTFDLIQTF